MKEPVSSEKPFIETVPNCEMHSSNYHLALWGSMVRISSLVPVLWSYSVFSDCRHKELSLLHLRDA
jgi:hypothetical protein